MVLSNMLCFNSTNGLHKTKVISTFGFRIPTISSLRGKRGENPKIKNRLTCNTQQIKRFYWYPEPGSNRHDIAVIGV